MILTADSGADAARVQLANARVRADCGHCPSVQLEVEAGVPALVDVDAIPVSGAFPALHGTDESGMLVEIVLIVMDGYVTALEVWRGDGEELVALPVLDGFERVGAPSWDPGAEPEWLVTGGWAHRVQGSVNEAGWTVSVDGTPHRIDVEAPSPIEAAPRIIVDGTRLKPKLRLAYNRTSAAAFRLDQADAELRLHIWAPPYLERLRRTLLGALRRLPIFFWMPHLAVSPDDAGVEWRYALIVDRTEIGTIVWFPGKGFGYELPGSVS